MRLLRVRRAMGRGVKGLWVVIATGILRGLLARQGGRYERDCEKWWADIRLMLDMQIQSAVGFVLTVSWRFGWESSCVRIRRGLTIGPVYYVCKSMILYHHH